MYLMAFIGAYTAIVVGSIALERLIVLVTGWRYWK